MSKKHECTKENLLNADKARDFQRIARNHPKWLRWEPGRAIIGLKCTGAMMAARCATGGMAHMAKLASECGIRLSGE